MIKLSISNIGWEEEKDGEVFSLMNGLGFSGLEVAPSRVFHVNPYDDLIAAREWSSNLSGQYGFVVSSIQSIWYGRSELLFGEEEERKALLAYTKKAIVFAETIGCKNIVFGCPKNRFIPSNKNADIAIRFFKEIGDYAFEHHTVIAIEANPPIYNTNFINRTEEAFAIINEVNSPGFLLNLDVGTMIENNEKISVLDGREHLINHVHISEPRLLPIVPRDIHKALSAFLNKIVYKGFVSIEVGRQENLDSLKKMMEYVVSVFEAHL